ncbi:MAG: hypothetical protein IPP91_10805 [Betaproteobacteria bacterium]|nr:hypothetical protein [Betaproteobacteria bacterium]
MTDSSIPSYAGLIAIVVIMANLATAWLVVLAMGENSGGVFSEGPPWIAVGSGVTLALWHYNVILPAEMSFWGSVLLGAMGLWGSWVDYARLSDRRRALDKARQDRKSAS